MNDEHNALRDEFTHTAEVIQTLAFIARDVTLQRDALSLADSMGVRLTKAKEYAIAERDEAKANELLCMQLALTAITNQLKMCIALKEEAAEAAWAYLVEAQSACAAAAKVRSQVDNGPPAEQLANLHGWLLQLERLVFPPQVFMSVGGTIEERECSICANSYESCRHVKGRAYMGIVCHTIIRHMVPEEVSFVDNPANKHARVTHFADAGRRRNRMTWKLEDDPEAAT